MSIKRILAAASASVVAVSAMAVVASAYKWEPGFVEAWTQKEYAEKADFEKDVLDGKKLSDIDTITFKSAAGEMKWGIGFEKVGGWWQTDTSEGAWWSGDKEFSIKGSDFNPDKFYFKFCADASEADVAVEVTYTLKAGGSNDDNKGDNSNVDTGVEGVAAVLGVAALAAGAMIVSKKRK